MRRIEGTDKRPYKVYMEHDYTRLVGAIKEVITPSNICVITDTNVEKLYLEKICTLLKEIAPVHDAVFEAGEHAKQLNTVTHIYDTLLSAQVDRSSLIVALGGGVVGDLAGFVASSYMRGIPFIQIPTTIVAQNDSSIGGKVGVDYLNHKNMVGAFYNPLLIYTNIKTLNTLPEREFCGGISEVIKHGIIRDSNLFEYLENNKEAILQRQEDVLVEMTYQSAAVKTKVVEEDQKESHLRKILNFGHTIGHAIETLSDFTLNHGECVAYGMVMASYISYRRNYVTEEVLKRIENLCKTYHLLSAFPTFDLQAVVNQTHYDKKKAHGQIAFVLIKGIGHSCIVNDVTEQEMIDALQYITSITQGNN